MRVVLAAGAGVVVDLGGPGAGVPAVVGEGGDRDAEALVAGPAEVHGAVLAGFLGDRRAARERGDGVRPGIGLAAVAPLGEHLGGVDLTRPWQRREDRPVRVLPEVGGDGAVEVLDRRVQGCEHADGGEHGVAERLAEGLASGAGRGVAQACQEGRGAAAAGVAVLGAERGHPLLAQVRCGGRGGVAGQELQADRRLDVGEDRLGARPVRVQQRGQLVGGSDPHLNHVAAGPHDGAQRIRLVGVGGGGLQLVRAQPQVLGDHRGVASVGLRPGQHLAVPPGLDRVRADRHHRVPGLQQQVDQAAVRALDGDRHTAGLPVPGQAADQQRDPVRGMLDGEPGHDLAPGVHHAHRVRLGGPVDPGEEQRFRQRKRHGNSSRWQRRPGGGEAGSRAVTNWRSAARPAVAGLQPRENRGRRCHAGPSRATAPGRHPGSRRVPTKSTVSVPLIRMVP